MLYAANIVLCIPSHCSPHWALNLENSEPTSQTVVYYDYACPFAFGKTLLGKGSAGCCILLARIIREDSLFDLENRRARTIELNS